ncbi:MAG: pyridoxamine 5'-phosphate oxidase [Alphaproteobacteria bacterium]|nr:pyridoxamine 5'-phosphate oxidase [Alphaproteobacteria bacterium]
MSATDNEAARTEQLFDDANTHAIDPLELFDLWLEKAHASEPGDANAMSVATIDENGLPDCRTILLKGRTGDGFVFYTNFQSPLGVQLLANPRAALCFYWKSLRRQVRVRGPVTVVDSALADAYFQSRPKGSRIGAHASDQSRPLSSRAHLAQKVDRLGKEFGDDSPIPRPEHWSGFCLSPQQIEFWQAGEFRLHDRVRFSTADQGAWRQQRLYP